jgi:hypothetical protein
VQFDTKATVQTQLKCNNFINTAIACKCAQDLYSPRDTLKSIRVFTLKSFNIAHSAGTEVTEYFKYIDRYTSGKLTKISISDFIAPINFISYSRYDNFEFYLDKMPDTPIKAIQFEVISEFRNGKILKDTTTVTTLY